MGASESKPVFNKDKCKVQLRMLASRLDIRMNKEKNLSKQSHHVIAELLRDQKEHAARIKVEDVIKVDYKLEAFEKIKNYATALDTRYNIFVSSKTVAPEIKESIFAILVAGHVLGDDIAELAQLFNQITGKYGKEFTQEVLTVAAAATNDITTYVPGPAGGPRPEKLPPTLAEFPELGRFIKVIHNSKTPHQTVVREYLTTIASAHGVEYIPTPDVDLSSTTGLHLPEPGKPMPGSVPPEQTDPSTMVYPSQPLTQPMPLATPVPPPVVPTMPAVHSTTVGYASAGASSGAVTIALTKRHPEGFGLKLDADNVVKEIKTAEAASKCAVGDQCIAFNDKPVSRDSTVKLLAADCNEGDVATFTMLPRVMVASSPIVPNAAAPPALPATVPVAPTRDLDAAAAVANPIVAPVVAPVVAAFAPVVPPAAPAAPAAPVAPVAPVAPSSGESRDDGLYSSQSLGGAPVTMPPTPPSGDIRRLDDQEDEDDILAKRLADLKRS